MSLRNPRGLQGAVIACPLPPFFASLTLSLQESQTAISSFLYTSWKVIFYITNLQGWFLLQLQQAYNDAGQFTRWGRFRQAMKENVAVSSTVARRLFRK